MVDSLRSLFWFPFLFLVAGGLVLGGCDSGGLAPDQSLKNGVALSGSENTDVAAIATHREGEWLAALSREGPAIVSEVVYSTEDGGRALIKLDSTGRPSLAAVGSYILTFGNYNGNRADVGLVNTESGKIKTSDQVDLGIDFGTLGLSEADSTDISPARAIEGAGYGATAFVCSMAAMSAPDSSSAKTSCQTSVLLQVTTSATKQADWKDSAELLGFGIDSSVCADYGDSCLKAITEISIATLGEGQALIDKNKQIVAQASGVVRFGGTWAYRDSNQSWLVVEQELVYDISKNILAECYFIRRLEPLGVNGSVFRYKDQEGGGELILDFNRISTDVLTATRLSDGREFKWDRASSLNLQNLFDNECSSSSATLTSETLSRQR